MGVRQFSRVHFTIEASVNASGHVFAGTVENLSMHGMLLITEERLPLGEPVTITITLAGDSPDTVLSICGMVSRVADNGLAFNFEKLDLESYIHLKNIISYNIDDPDKVLQEIFHPG